MEYTVSPLFKGNDTIIYLGEGHQQSMQLTKDWKLTFTTQGIDIIATVSQITFPSLPWDTFQKYVTETGEFNRKGEELYLYTYRTLDDRFSLVTHKKYHTILEWYNLLHENVREQFPSLELYKREWCFKNSKGEVLHSLKIRPDLYSLEKAVHWEFESSKRNCRFDYPCIYVPKTVDFNIVREDFHKSLFKQCALRCESDYYSLVGWPIHRITNYSEGAPLIQSFRKAVYSNLFSSLFIIHSRVEDSQEDSIILRSSQLENKDYDGNEINMYVPKIGSSQDDSIVVRSSQVENNEMGAHVLEEIELY